MLAALFALLKALPMWAGILREAISLFTSLCILLKKNRQDKQADKVEADFGAGLKAAAKQVKAEKKKSIKAMQDALSGNIS